MSMILQEEERTKTSEGTCKKVFTEPDDYSTQHKHCDSIGKFKLPASSGACWLLALSELLAIGLHQMEPAQLWMETRGVCDRGWLPVKRL